MSRRPRLPARAPAARLASNAEGLWAAAREMVKYEQEVVLQEAIGDTPQKLAFWTNFSQEHGHRIRAPYPGAKSFREHLPNGDYGNAAHRMQWFNEELFDNARQWLESLEPDGLPLNEFPN